MPAADNRGKGAVAIWVPMSFILSTVYELHHEPASTSSLGGWLPPVIHDGQAPDNSINCPGKSGLGFGIAFAKKRFSINSISSMMAAPAKTR